MQINLGGRLNTEDAMGRANEVAKYWRVLERQGLVISAERRIGICSPGRPSTRARRSLRVSSARLSTVPACGPSTILPPVGKRTGVDVSTLDVPVREKSANEHIRLQILAQQNDLRAHSSHPLAMASESDSPSVENLGSLPTRAGPSPSRVNHLPLAPPAR